MGKKTNSGRATQWNVIQPQRGKGTDTGYSIAELHKQYVEEKMADPEDHMLYDPICRKCLESVNP